MTKRLQITVADWALSALIGLEQSEGDRPIRITEVANVIGATASAVGHNFQSMVSAGLVVRIERKTTGMTPGYRPHAIGYRSTEKGRTALTLFLAELRSFQNRAPHAQQETA